MIFLVPENAIARSALSKRYCQYREREIIDKSFSESRDSDLPRSPLSRVRNRLDQSPNDVKKWSLYPRDE